MSIEEMRIKIDAYEALISVMGNKIVALTAERDALRKLNLSTI